MKESVPAGRRQSVHQEQLSRSEFLRAAALALLTSSVATAGCRDWFSPTMPDSFPAAASRLSPAEAALQRIGAFLRQSLPELTPEKSARWLWQRLPPEVQKNWTEDRKDNSGRNESITGSEHSLHRTLRQLHQIDLQQNQTLSVQGWIFSQTEAYLYSAAG